jgi:hypothetical protein
LKIFGCDVYSLIPKYQCSKLDSRSKKYIFVGYDDVVKRYILWDPTSHKIIISRVVVFDESPLIKSNVVEVELKQEQVPQHQEIWLEIQPSTETRKQEEAYEEQEDVETPHLSLRRFTQDKNPPKRYEDYVSPIALITNYGEPSCYHEAMDDVESSKWRIAME